MLIHSKHSSFVGVLLGDYRVIFMCILHKFKADCLKFLCILHESKKFSEKYLKFHRRGCIIGADGEQKHTANKT